MTRYSSDASRFKASNKQNDRRQQRIAAKARDFNRYLSVI
ncbi:hypothetical protein MITS9508_00021 [Synechococcus sp. MIT S9508]|nr:hypothetical protein MITS9508_00021 [Synechococcus sp. MIT S9508]